MKDEFCPTKKVEILENREIILTDEKTFPWKQDQKGYFLVKIENNLICCGFVNYENKLIIEFRGKDSDKMIKEITKRNICSIENLAYISAELTLAEQCLKDKKQYVQR